MTRAYIAQEEMPMKAARTKGPSDDVIVLISGPSRGLGECVIRKTPEIVKLGDQVYRRYRIVKPRGFEKEEILHPVDQGTAGLLGNVFSTLACGGTRRSAESLRSGE
jgi:nickel-dependent lactate racemase